MPDEHTTLDIPERMLRYATDVAGWQLDETERDMRRHPGHYAEYTDVRERVTATEADLICKLGGAPMALEAFSDATNACAAALAIEMYLRGVLDGGRLFYAFTARELPGKEDGA